MAVCVSYLEIQRNAKGLAQSVEVEHVWVGQRGAGRTIAGFVVFTVVTTCFLWPHNWDLSRSNFGFFPPLMILGLLALTVIYLSLVADWGSFMDSVGSMSFLIRPQSVVCLPHGQDTTCCFAEFIIAGSPGCRRSRWAFFHKGFRATTHNISVPETKQVTKPMEYILLSLPTVNYLNYIGAWWGTIGTDSSTPCPARPQAGFAGTYSNLFPVSPSKVPAHMLHPNSGRSYSQKYCSN